MNDNLAKEAAKKLWHHGDAWNYELVFESFKAAIEKATEPFKSVLGAIAIGNEECGAGMKRAAQAVLGIESRASEQVKIHKSGDAYVFESPLDIGPPEPAHASEPVLVKPTGITIEIIKRELDDCDHPECVEERKRRGFSSCAGGHLARRVVAAVTLATHASESPELTYNRGYDAGWEAHKERSDSIRAKRMQTDDTKRLDWLDEHGWNALMAVPMPSTSVHLREWIDAAMRKETHKIKAEDTPS